MPGLIWVACVDCGEGMHVWDGSKLVRCPACENAKGAAESARILAFPMDPAKLAAIEADPFDIPDMTHTGRFYGGEFRGQR